MENPEEKLKDCIERWQEEGASPEFIKLVEEVFAPFMRLNLVRVMEKKDTDVFCDASVELIGLMVSDLAGSVVGMNDRNRVVIFFNKFLFNLANDLNETANRFFGVDGEMTPVSIPPDPTKH